MSRRQYQGFASKCLEERRAIGCLGGTISKTTGKGRRWTAQQVREAGPTGGRPKALDTSKAVLAYQLYDDRHHSVAEICEMVGISKPTLYTYLRQRSNSNQHMRYRPRQSKMMAE